MDVHVRLESIREALDHFGAEADFGLAEIANLQQEGRRTDLYAEATAALQSIKNAVMFNEIIALESPVAADNGARSIRQALKSTLLALQVVILRIDAAIEDDPQSAASADHKILGGLLSDVGTHMLEWFTKISDELDTIAKVRAPSGLSS